MGRTKDELSRMRKYAGTWGSGKDPWFRRCTQGEVAGNGAAKMRRGRRMTTMMTTVDCETVDITLGNLSFILGIE